MQHTAPDTAFSTLTSRQRLADISHHFLSEEGERAAPWRNTRLIPLLLVCREDDFVAYLLEDALRRHRHSCSVLNIETQPETPAPASTLLPDEENGAPAICLLPLTSPGSILAIPHNKLLMAVPASLPGIRLAYHHLAQLAEQKNHLTVNIIMLDARNRQHGERYFSFLRDSASSLLSLEVKAAGVLVQRKTADGDTYGGTDRVVENILREERDTPASPLSPGLNSPPLQPVLNNFS